MEDIYFCILLELDNIPPLVVAATSLRGKQKSIPSIKSTTLLVDDDQVLNKHNMSSSGTQRGWGRRGRGRGRGRGRRGSFQNNANVYHFQDPSRVSNVVGKHPRSLTIPLL